MLVSNTLIQSLVAGSGPPSAVPNQSRFFHTQLVSGVLTGYFLYTFTVGGLQTSFRMYSGVVGAVFSEVGSGSRPTFTDASQAIFDSEIDGSGIIHVLAIETSGSPDTLYYTTFNTTTNTWSAKESITTSNAFMAMITVDASGLPHVAYVAGGGIFYTNRVLGSWAAPIRVGADAPSDIEAFRCANNLLGLFYADGPNMYAFFRGVSAADAFGSRQSLSTLAGLSSSANQLDVEVSKSAFHIVAWDNQLDYFEIPARTPIHIERVEADIIGVADNYTWHRAASFEVTPKFSMVVSDDGETVCVIANTSDAGGSPRHTIVQRSRFARSEGFEPGGAHVLLTQPTGSSTTTYDAICAGMTIDNDRVYVGLWQGGTFVYMLESTLDRSPRAGITHDVVLSLDGYMLAGPMTKVDITASIPRISIASEQRRDFDFSELDTFGQFTWHQGRGEKYLLNPQAFSDSDNVLTHIPNQATLSLRSYQASKTGGGSFDFNGKVVKFIVFAANWYALVEGTAVANNALYVWDNTNTEFDTVSITAAANTILVSAGSVPRDMVVYGEDLYIALGEAVNMIFDDLNVATWKDAQVPARALAVWDSKLWRADNLNELYYSTNPDSATPTWTLAGTVKDADSFINRLVVYQDALIVFKEDGVFAVERAGTAGTYNIREISDEDPYRDVDSGTSTENGMAGFVDKGLLYWNRREQVVRFDGASTTPIGPERGADTLGSNFIGLPADERGEFRSFTSDGAFIYGATTPSSGAVPQVMVYNGVGWHSFWKGVTANNAVKALAFLPIRTTTGILAYPTLWFGDGNNIRYMKLPRGSYNPLDDTTLEYINTGTSFLEMAIYDANLPLVDKVFGELVVSHDIPPSSITTSVFSPSIRLNEQSAASGLTGHTNDNGWWSIAATLTQYSRDLRFVFGEATGAGSIAGGAPAARRIATRLVLIQNATATYTPAIRGCAYRFVAKPRERYGWTAPLKLYSSMTRLDDRDETETVDALRAVIYRLRTENMPVFFDDSTTTPTYLRNVLEDPAFQITGFSVAIGSVAENAFCTLHRRYKDKSQWVSITDTASEDGVASPSQGLLLPKGTPLFASVEVLNDGPGIITVQLYDQTAGAALGSIDVDPSDGWKRIEVTGNTTATGNSYRVRVIRKANGFPTNFHLDAAQLIPGVMSYPEFIDGDQPRCYWTGSPNGSDSVRRPGYITYITGLSEVFRYRKTDIAEPAFDSEVTIQLREIL